MMEAYDDGEDFVPPALYARLALYKTMSDLLWALWGMVEHANGNPSDDFRAYALERLEHCKMRMGDPDFGGDLALVARAGRGASASRAHFRSDPKRKAAIHGTPRRNWRPAGTPPAK